MRLAIRSSWWTTPEQAKVEFLKQKFEKGKVFWESLATFVLDELKHVNEEDPAVEATYTYRVKEEKSLRKRSKRCRNPANVRS